MYSRAKRKKIGKLRLIGIGIASILILVAFFGLEITRATSAEWTGTIATSFAGGTGTEADPYLISNGEQLAYLAETVNNGTTYLGNYIKLTDNILLNGMNSNGTFIKTKEKNLNKYTSIGTGATKPFMGNFDGNGKEVIGIYINKTWPNYWGLFGYASEGSMIQNVTISGSIKGYSYTGGIAGYTNGIVSGCAINSTVTGSYYYAGGVAGYAGATSQIINCSVTKNVTGMYYTGGIAGGSDSIITGCAVNCIVNGTENNSGGIVGYAATTASTVAYCTVSGTVKGRYYVGGIAGYIEGTLIESQANCTVAGTENYVGGIAGYAADNSAVSDCDTTGVITGRYYVGGVVGRTDESIEGCSSTSTVAGVENYVGGIAGYSNTDSVVTESSSTGTITGRYYVGGVAGYTDGEVSLSTNSGTVTGIEGDVGGIVGYADSNNVVSNNQNTGDISGRTDIGGIAGGGDWSSDGSSINNNLSIGTVTGQTNVGGVVGNVEGTLTTEDAWNNYYENAPSGTGDGDVWEFDGATPIGDMTWDELVEALNTDNPVGDNVWGEDENGVPTPGVYVPDDALEILAAAIIEGKYYTEDSLGTATSAAITSDSVFSVFYAAKYNVTTVLQDQTIGLLDDTEASVSIPTGAAVTMKNGDSYYYINLSTAKDKITLSEFTEMGNTSGAAYSADSAQPDTQQTYLFVFDFTNVTDSIAANTYQVALLNSEGDAAGSSVYTEITGENIFSLEAVEGTGLFTANLYKVESAGYDYKTDEKFYAYEFYLEKDSESVSLPIGTKVNGTTISSSQPYAFVSGQLGETEIYIDTVNSINPLEAGSYVVNVKAYVCSDITNPRNGYLIGSDSSTITLTEPEQFAITANAQTRIFDYSTSQINVPFMIETLGTGTVKSTLQNKVGLAYVDIADQLNKTVTINAGEAVISIPGGYAKGTYRYILTLYDNNGIAKASTVENVIIK